MTEDRDAPPNIWALVDDRAGNRSQVLGVADVLGFPYEIRDLTYGAFAKLPNFLLGDSFAGLEQHCREALRPPWPDLILSCGRRTVPVARKIKRLSGNRTRLVHVMWPQGGGEEFDLIAVPNHDGRPERSNVLKITGSPHGFTPEKLAVIAGEWHGRFDDLPRPWIAVIVGGSTKNRTFTPDMARELGRMVSEMASVSGGSLLVSTSRRTGAEPAEALTAAIGGPKAVFRWGEGGDNPYGAFLALADAIVVSGDSMSMCSEACAPGKPVYIFAPPALISAKHARLHAELFETGHARPLTGELDIWSAPPFNPAGYIAAEIRKRLEFRNA